MRKLFALMIVLLAVSIAAVAVTPQFWEDFTPSDLLKGKLDHVSVTPDGRLFLASDYSLVYDTGQPYIFSMVRDKAGNLYVGTGDEGKVFKIDPQGKGSLYFQSKELDIFAMALDSSDVLYVGTSPDGKVYKVTGPNQGAEFCDLSSKYIWSMIFDVAGNLYVGTGSNGTIYKVDKGGKQTAFYTCTDNHVVTLVRDNNNILAGTSPGGLIIEINPEGKGFTLLDSTLEEVHSLTVDRSGTIYALVSSSRGLATAPAAKTATASKDSSSTPTATVTVETVITIPEKKDTKTATPPASERELAGAKSAVYAITKSGSTETIYSSSEQMVYDSILKADGSLLIATGPKGRLFSIDTEKQVTVLTDTPEEQVTRLLSAGDVIYAGTGNQGKVYKLLSQRAQTGTFESNALDAKIVSSWGKISWKVANPAGAEVGISTRTGNTDKADSSWSDWSTPYSGPGQQVTSPRARFLQWRAAFKKSSGAAAGPSADSLDDVKIAYLQQNLRPQVAGIDVLPYGVELQKQSALSIVGLSIVPPSDGRPLNAPRERSRDRQSLSPRQVLTPGAQSFTWKATDDNEDTLEYSLYFKGDGESEWKQLAKKLEDTFYTLNTASLPDGTYRLKVVASDAPNNPYDKFLIGELISDPFVIVNSTPKVEVITNKVNGKRVEAQFRAGVTTGRIATAEFSIDGGEWNLIFPVDGIADSAMEEYKIATPELSTGEHLIGIRTSGADGNTGTSKLIVKIP